MLRLNLLLICTFIFVNISIAQFSQLTYIQNPVAILKYELHGLVDINGIEYLIESNKQSLRVTKMDESPEVLYEVDYPSYNPLHLKNGRLNTRSGFAVNDIYLYEIFKKSIQQRNLLTGEIVETYYLTAGQLLYINNIEFTENMFHFELSRNFDFGTYNKTTEKFNFLEFEKNVTYRSENIYYTKGENSEIEIYNSENKTSTYQYENENILSVSSNNIINGLSGLIFTTLTYSRFVNEDTTFLLDCTITEPFSHITSVREDEDHLFYFYEFENEATFQIRVKNNCSDSHSTSYPKTHEDHFTKVFDSPTFNQDYILFGWAYGSINPIGLVIIDKEAASIHTLDIDNINYIDDKNFYRKGDELYFIGHDGGDPSPIWSLFSINLETKTIKTIHAGLSYDIPISFGSSESNTTMLLTISNDESLQVFYFKNGDNAELLFTSADTKNGGINSIRFLATDEYKIAYQIKNEVYFFDFLFGDEPLFEAEEISDLFITNNTLEGLFNFEDSTYYLSYNYYNKYLTKELLDRKIDVHTTSINLTNYILGQFSVDDKIYFEIESKSFKDIPIEGNILSIHRSKNHVLFLSDCGSEYCLTSFLDGTFSTYEFSFQNQPDVFSKENGNFLVLEPKFNSKQTLYAISKDGVHIDKITIDGSKLTINQESIASGQLGAMMFYNDDTEDLTVVLQRDSKFQKFEIPYTNVNSIPIIWYKAGNSLIFSSEDFLHQGIYICTLGKTLKKLELNDIGFPPHKLLMAFAKDNIISIIVDSFLDDLQIVIYDSEAEKINFIKDVDLDYDFAFLYDEDSINTKFQITNDHYLITLLHQPEWEIYENSEFFNFNTKLQILTPTEDINWDVQSSNPHNFLENDDNLFFLARSPLDNSYQLFSEFKDVSTSIKNLNINLGKIDVVPNPSSDFISVSIDADHINIYNLKGKLLFSRLNYKAKDQINIEELQSGMYFLETFRGLDNSITKFIKI